MSTGALADASERFEQHFPLRGRRPIVLDGTGIQHPRSPSGRGRRWTRWEDVTHLASSPRALWLATRGSVYIFPRRLFADARGPERLARSIFAAIESRSGGEAQLARMAEVERTARAPAPLRATAGLAILCVVVYVLQILLDPAVEFVGRASAPLVAAGDLWRLVTANFLHSREFPLHLPLNLIALFVLGGFLERALGTPRTLCVMAASGLGAMAAAVEIGAAPVVGASGIVFGMMGGILWLDYARAAELPAWWRIPRRTLWTLLLLNAGLSLLPFVSASAHFGGLFTGALATAAVAGPAPRWQRVSGRLRVAAASCVGLAALSLGTAAGELAAPGDYMARYLARLATLPDVSPLGLNNEAWLIATDPDADRELLEAALLLAERAVGDTDREDPKILDTLAEVQFQLGRDAEAIATIDEAIARAPGVRYFVEQRRRFTGARAPDDRPDPPLFGIDPADPAPIPDPPEPGIQV